MQKNEEKRKNGQRVEKQGSKGACNDEQIIFNQRTGRRQLLLHQAAASLMRAMKRVRMRERTGAEQNSNKPLLNSSSSSGTSAW